MAGFSRFKRFLKSFGSFSDFALFARVLAAYPVIHTLVVILPFNSLMKLLTPKRARPSWKNKPEKIVEYVTFALAAYSFVFRPTCLMRSLLLYRFLRMAGLGVDLHLGAFFNKRGKLKGHGWITLNGGIYPSTAILRKKFKKIYSHPPRPDSSEELILSGSA